MSRAPARALPARAPTWAPAPAPVATRTARSLEGLLGTSLRFHLRHPEDTAWVATSPHHVLYVAEHREDVDRIRREAVALRWLDQHGVPVPPVCHLAPDHTSLVTARVPDDLPEGPQYVRAALAAAEALAAAPPPPDAGSTHARLSGTRRRRTRIRRILTPVRAGLMLARIGVSPRMLVSARRSASRLPATVLSHGDFRAVNVLFDRAAGRVHVIDFEQLRLAPAGHDHLMLWSSLATRDDRDQVLRFLADRGPGALPSLGTLHRWVALRTAAGLLREDPADADLRRHARVLVDEMEQGPLVRGAAA